MKRRAIRICVFLILGAIVNVAVAWGCAVWLRIPSSLVTGTGFNQLVFPDYHGEEISGGWDTEVWSSSAGLAGYERFSIEPLAYQRTVSAGWPMLSLTGGIINNTRSTGVVQAPEWRVSTLGLSGSKRLIPLRPIWPGFAINTVLYAGVLWLLFAAPFALRRRRRIRRGLCPKCAYDLRNRPSDSSVCPECGAAAAGIAIALSGPTHVHRPFQWALGASIQGLAPAVQEHVLQPPGTVVVYRGRMRVWRDGGWRGTLAGWLLRVGTLTRFMFPETGKEIEFEIEHAVVGHDDGSLSMSWIRTFHFDRVKRRFDAWMWFHPDSGPVVMWTGCMGCLQVELKPRVERNEIVVISGREWLRLGRLRVPIPGWLKGRPHVRESQEPDGALRIHVEIHNTLLGHFFGYEGRYCKVQAGAGEPNTDCGLAIPSTKAVAL